MTRFAFGRNWRAFLQQLDDQRIDAAERSLKRMLDVDTLEERSFLDIGSGSGLFSLAARRLGARVRSFDYDRDSVDCTRELKRRYYPADSHWLVEQGSVLDEDYIASLGVFDFVYAWGVLHHTGDLQRALEHAARPVKLGGVLYVAIYNDQGPFSEIWTAIKRTYNRSPRAVRWFILIVTGAYLELKRVAGGVYRGTSPLRLWRQKKQERGMSVWYDIIDWAGGYPFEVAKPEKIFNFYRARGFQLELLKTSGGTHGNNEFRFRKLG